MSSTVRITPVLLRNRWELMKLSRSYSNQKSLNQTSYESSSHSAAVPNVPGLSEKVLKTPSGKVGPGASKDSEYKNPEYFSYNDMSYYEAELEMAKYRLPQPSPYSNQ